MGQRSSKYDFSIVALIFVLIFHNVYADDKTDNCIKSSLSLLDNGNQLVLDRCNLTSENMPALVDFLNAHPSYIFLDMSKNNTGGGGIRDEGLKTLLSAKNLTYLFIDRNNITDEGLKYLVDNNTLTDMSLSSNNITDKGAKLLAQMPNLSSLDIDDNYIGEEGAIILGKTHLESLSINSNFIGPKGAIGLAADENLISLQIDDNRIRDEGIIALARSNLQWLSANGDEISDEGFKALSENMSISTLLLDGNNITDEGAIAFTLSNNKNFVSISLLDNPLTHTGIDALRQKFGDKVILARDLNSNVKFKKTKFRSIHLNL